MHFAKRFFVFPILTLSTFMLTHCADSTTSHIENAQFHLDHGEYAEAQADAQAAVNESPDSVQANFLLASAELGVSVIGEDKTYLSYIVDLLNADPGTNPFVTFVAIAPSDPDNLTTLESARDLLISLKALAEGSQLRNVYLQLYIARLFEIAGAITRTGANSTTTDVCNANPSNPNNDPIPDGYDPGALTDAQAVRFNDNVNEINGDAANAGLSSDFGLNDRLTTMSTDLNADVDAAGGDVPAGTRQYFIDTFGDPTDEALCVL